MSLLRRDRKPIPHTVRVSRRARHLRIVIHPQGRVEVVLPEGCDGSLAQAFLESKRSWVEASLRRMEPLAVAPQPLLIPREVFFSATGECWPVRVRSGARVGYRQQEGAVVVSFCQGYEWVAPMQRWLTAIAKDRLTPWLDEISREFGLSYRKVSVRAQRSRWGSCSTSGQISLNRALLFLQPQQVRYLLIHELCHTVHMNHSRVYWALVRELCGGDYRTHDKALRGALEQIPAWAQPSHLKRCGDECS